MTRPPPLARATLLAVALAGCASEESGAPVVVGLTTDMAVGFDIDRLDTTAKVDGAVAVAESRSYSAGELSLPAELELPPARDGAAVELSVAAFRGGDASPVVVRGAATRVVAGRTLLLPVPLDGACVGVSCAAGETCAEGACVDPFIAPSSLADLDPAWLDSAPDACKASSSGEPSIVIGQGESAFAALEEGEAVTLEAGAQGGHHAWLALKVRGLRQMGSVLTLGGRFPDLAFDLPPAVSIVTLRKAEAGGCEIHGIRFQVDRGVSLDAVRGQALDVEISLEDPNGDAATARKQIVIAP